MTFTQGVLLFLAAMVAGMVNSIAGGGTLLSFPALVWIGVDPRVANATNSLALAPGAFASLWGYRDAMSETPRRYFVLLIPGLIGGVLGGWLLARTPLRTFERLVPWLVLFATVLFTLQPIVQRWLRKTSHEHTKHQTSSQWMLGAACYQFFTGVYGGYFGAGIGILLLAMLGVLGMTNLHQMNGLKNILAGAINLIAALYLITANLIHWQAAGVMALGALVGGYGMARVAQKLGQTFVRRAVIVIGFTLSAIFFWRS
ncbi:MAG: sulfite exporter TauE/SafE family protein [Acidobacteria bacterium]|nr:sulfite exporter TauE/SafE family protein [Acidobacteriota bacterium]